MSTVVDDLKKAAQIVAPTVASFIGGPLAGQAVAQLSSWLLGKPDASPDEITQAIGMATPEQIAAVRKNDQDYQARMAELGIDASRLVFDDREGARKREETVKDKFPGRIGAFVIVAFVATTALVLLGYAKVDSALAGTLIGYLSAKAEQVLSYYFGSSAGSDRKTELLAAAPAIASPASVPARPA